jgi:hypothetical protein
MSTIGLCSIVIFIFYIIKKVDDYLYFKKEDNKNINFDEDSDE